MSEKIGNNPEDLAQELFRRGSVNLRVNSRRLTVRFEEDEKWFNISYAQRTGFLWRGRRPLGGASGTTEKDTFLSLGDSVRIALTRKITKLKR